MWRVGRREMISVVLPENMTGQFILVGEPGEPVDPKKALMLIPPLTGARA
jgi:hypothetical protein